MTFEAAVILLVISVLANLFMLAYSTKCRELMVEAKQEVDNCTQYLDGLDEEVEK